MRLVPDPGVTAPELGTDSSDPSALALPVVESRFAVSSVSLGSARGVPPVTPDPVTPDVDDEGVGRLGPGSASSSLSLLPLDLSW